MSRIEEFLEIEDKYKEALSRIKELEAELEEKSAKILEITESLSEIQNSSVKNEAEVKHLNSRLKFLEEDKKSLEEEKSRLQKVNEKLMTQMEKWAAMVEQLNVALVTKEDLLLAKDKRIEEMDKRLEEQLQLNINYKEEKANFIEEKINEMVALTEKVGNLERKIDEDQEKIKSLKQKKKSATDDLFSKEMQMDQVAARVKELESEIEKYKSGEILPDTEEKEPEPEPEPIETTSGIFRSKEEIHNYLIAQIKRTNRTMRLIVPDIEELVQIDFISLLEQLSGVIIVNLACKADIGTQWEMINKLKNKGVKITNYDDNPIYGISVDGSIVALGTVEDNIYTGFYTENKNLIGMLNQSIMQPFIRGSKLN